MFPSTHLGCDVTIQIVFTAYQACWVSPIKLFSQWIYDIYHYPNFCSSLSIELSSSSITETSRLSGDNSSYYYSTLVNLSYLCVYPPLISSILIESCVNIPFMFQSLHSYSYNMFYFRHKKAILGYLFIRRLQRQYESVVFFYTSSKQLYN